MSLEIPYDDIQKLQISLRREAGLSHYNPDETAFPDLPSAQDAISQLDPSPEYLRCKHCKGRLLRGILSMICVFCGRQVDKDVPPEPIKFISTFGSRWFLQSLDLDGSELVDLSVRQNEPNRGQNAQKNELPLSEFLDLEIRWQAESVRSETSVSKMTMDQRLSTLNFSGVDLDNFSMEGKWESVSTPSEQQSAVNKQNEATGGNAVEGNVNLSLFENVQASATAGTSKIEESGDSFSGWDAEYQSADSGTQQEESKFSDPFVGSTSVDLSAHMDSVFGPTSSNEKTKEYSKSASHVDDWFKGDAWSNPTAGVTVEPLEVHTNDIDGGKVGNPNDSIDWFQDNQRQTASTTTSKAADAKTIAEDSFDAWDDFTSATSVNKPSNDASQIDVNHTTPSVHESSGVNFFGVSNRVQDVDFSSFPQQDFFSGTFNGQNGSLEVNILQPETSVSKRVDGVENLDGVATEVEKGGGGSDASTQPKVDDAEILMLQMHDLSFMLESNLSVPQKKDLQKTDAFGSFSTD